jgi:hypothetical protein
MVYDDGGNVVGDTHWRQEHNFDEGEELELERSGKLVQVTEFEGKRNQDLTELLEKRLKEREERVAIKTSDSLVRPPHHLREQMLGTVIRILVQAISLAELSQQKPSKRRKPNDYLCKSGYAQSLTGAKLALSAKSTSTSPQTRPPEAENVRAINLSSAHSIQTKRHRAKAKTECQTSPPKESYASYMSPAQLTLRCNLSGATLATGCADKSFGEMEHGKSKSDNAFKEGVSKVEYLIENPKLSGVFTPSQRHNSGCPAEPFATTGANIRLQHSPVVEPYTSKAQERSSLFEQSKPLRIKSRPKKKLLYMDNPQPRPQASLASRTNSCESIPVKKSIPSPKDPKDSRKMPGTRAVEGQVTVRDNMLIIGPNTERPKIFTSLKHRCSIYDSNKQTLSEESLLRDIDIDRTLDINAEKDFVSRIS